MSENFRKIRSMLVVLVMLLSALTISIFVFENTSVQAADTIYADSVAGDDTTGAGTSTNPYATIQKAINDTDEAGDIVIVRDGTYNLKVFINQSGVQLKSQNGSATTIIAPSSTSGHAISVGATGVCIGGQGTGFNITGRATSFGTCIAAEGSNGNGLRIRNCVFRIQNAGESQSIWIAGASTNAQIINNTFFGTNPWTSNSVMGTAGTGIIVVGANSANALNISNNTYYNSKYAFVTLHDDGGSVTYDGVRIENNTAYKTRGPGYSYNQEIVRIGGDGTTTIGSTYNGVVIRYNTFNESGYGIRIRSTTAGAANILINYNNLYNFSTSLFAISHESTGTINAKYNWWGHINGPNSTADNRISNPTRITTTPWLTAPYPATTTSWTYGTPGKYRWEGCNGTLGVVRGTSTVTNNSVNTSTSLLYYGREGTITMNGSLTWDTQAGERYYLYYPVYYGDDVDGNDIYNLYWRQWGTEPTYTDPVIRPDEKDYVFGDGGETDVLLNRSGLWVIAKSASGLNGSTPAQFMETIPAWFWVNTSTDYTIETNFNTWYYDDESQSNLRVTVKQGGVPLNQLALVAIVDAYTQTLPNSLAESPAEWDYSRTVDGIGNVSTETNATRFERAGNWTIMAFWDMDGTGALSSGSKITYREGQERKRYYNTSYGNFSSTYLHVQHNYSWYSCGPWDPPEYNATQQTLRVYSGTPYTSIPTANKTQLWGRTGNVNVTLHESDTIHNISAPHIIVRSQNLSNITGDVSIWTGRADEGWFWVNSSSEGWGKDSSGNIVGANGTYTIEIMKDETGDASSKSALPYQLEWNGSVTFTIQAPSGVHFEWVDDDGPYTYGGVHKNNDGVIARVPPMWIQPFWIQFQIRNAEGTYLGAGDLTKDKKNISITGDVMYSGTLNQIPAATYWSGNNTWGVPITPLMSLNGGTITIQVSWGSYGSHTETLTVGGSSNNGTVVSISPAEFNYGTNTTLTVTVTNPAGTALEHAYVYLRWVTDGGNVINSSGLINSSLSGSGGVYTFFFNTTQQKNNQTAAYGEIKAPRNVTAYVYQPNLGWGYAKAKMKETGDLKVDIWPETLMAGKKYDFKANVSVVDANGNRTGAPKDSDLKIRIYNETDVDVTGTITGSSITATGLDGNNWKNVSNFFITEPGIYHVHAYNDTHYSTGWNATLEVKTVTITANISELIWKIDKNRSVQFEFTYEGAMVNGTVRFDNLSLSNDSKYNRTWTNTSFNNVTGSDASAVFSSRELQVTNGMITIYNITAAFLDAGKSSRNISYFYKPDGASAWIVTKQKLEVKIPDITASPASIPIGETSDIGLTVTGRGVGLQNVFVSWQLPGSSTWSNGTTDADGKLTFSANPTTTGNILLRIENRTSATKIKVTNWKLYLDAPVSVNENEEFTMTVRNGSISGDGLVGATVLFNSESFPTGADGTVTFTAPEVAANIIYTATATLEGYAETSKAITIINTPKLFITISAEKDGDVYISPIQVAISDDTGELITGVTVTMDGKSKDTVEGKVSFTITGDKKEYTITATKTGFTTATKTIEAKGAGIPGFELLTLLAALGVAFILFKRRRR